MEDQSSESAPQTEQKLLRHLKFIYMAIAHGMCDIFSINLFLTHNGGNSSLTIFYFFLYLQ